MALCSQKNPPAVCPAQGTGVMLTDKTRQGSNRGPVQHPAVAIASALGVALPSLAVPPQLAYASQPLQYVFDLQQLAERLHYHWIIPVLGNSTGVHTDLLQCCVYCWVMKLGLNLR